MRDELADAVDAPSPLALLRAKGIRIAFGGTVALDGVDFELRAGEVHVLAGENGAGKSTLIKICAGLHRHWRGSLELRGPDGVLREERLGDPRAAFGQGIATIHQELSLVPSLRVVDNLFLGAERTRRGLVAHGAQLREARRQLAAVGLGELDPLRPVASLPLAVQQLVEIAKALARGAHIWLLDEPSSALDAADAELLFEHVERLRAAGCGIVYISHKLEEIYRLADRITVLRDGRHVVTRPAAELPETELLRAMLGQELLGATGVRAPTAPHPEHREDPPLLDVRRLDVTDPLQRGRHEVAGFSLRLQRGEIVGLAGLAGSGRSAVLAALFGALGPRALLDASFEGQPYRPRSPRAAIRHGVGYLPGDRKRHGIVPARSVLENASLSSLDLFVQRGFVARRRERTAVAAGAQELGLRAPSLDAPILALSGGNQQKVLLQRMLMPAPALLLLDEPTRGIDVGAKLEVRTRVRALAASGCAVLWSSSELPELFAVCDRIVVLARGCVTGIFTARDFDAERILARAMGSAPQA